MPRTSVAQLQLRPYWDETGLPMSPVLDRDLTVDSLVVGGGITGITTAFLLAKAGCRVALVERRTLVSGDTRATTAHLTPVTDERLTSLVTSLGEERARRVWEAGAAAIDEIARIVTATGIECGFARVPGFLHAPVGTPDDNDRESVHGLVDELHQARKVDWPVEWIDPIPLLGQPGIRFEQQGRIHPRTYLAGLLMRLREMGALVFERSEAREIKGHPPTVMVGPHRVHAGTVVFATHNPRPGKHGFLEASLLQTKLALYTTYAVGAVVPQNHLVEGLYWDTATPYTYLRVDRAPGQDTLILGGEDHKTGQANDAEARFARLEEKLRRLVPHAVVTHHWSGQVIETPDGLPFIGESAKGQFVATGFAGNGMTFGTIAAMVVSDAAMKRPDRWGDLFDVNRTVITRAAWDYAKENVDYPYYLIRDRLAAPDARSLDAVAPGDGKIVRVNGRRLAVHRRDDGSLVARSAVCTHLGCVVRWNSAARTWDCPCHGSRFTTDGDVLAGPAERPLDRD
jgi:glycine/D-amino acid oxidase-like deaminating enzyme/nitrite reductase/ring-hydroxylating ferredoxin subunit